MISKPPLPRPSSASIWFNCPAMPLMSSRAPEEPESDPAREGTCAAWVAEVVLTNVFPTALDVVGGTHENGWLVTVDMAHHIQGYVDKIRSYGGTIGVERKVWLNRIIGGTPDSYAILTSDYVLIVDDLKYGYDIVDPYRNHQISIYAGAILKQLAAHNHRIDKVVIGVYQPRTWHPNGYHRTWTCTPEELGTFVNEIKQAGDLTQVENPVANPGPHCKHCPAAPTCAASAHANYATYSQLCSRSQRHMSSEEMVNELEFLTNASDMLNGRLKAVRVEAAARIKRGEHFPGWHMEPGRGKRKFTKSPAVVRMLTGVDPEEKVMITPAELERRMSKDVSKDVMSAISDAPRTPPTLKRVRKNFYKNMFKRSPFNK